jgi:hypothetical protein
MPLEVATPVPRLATRPATRTLPRQKAAPPIGYATSKSISCRKKPSTRAQMEAR